MKNRLEWTDLEFIRDVVIILATQGWEKLIEKQDHVEQPVPNYVSAINHLGLKFKIPLVASGVVVASILQEFQDIILYATEFISLSSTNYQTVWWKIFHSPNAASWTNALKLAQLLFTLPVSNGKLERIFSTLKKSNNPNDLH